MPPVSAAARFPTGHVFRVERKRGPQWYAKYRLPDGRQVQRRIGPAWTERGRPAAGYFTKRLAQAWLGELLHEARRGRLPGMVQTGATFEDAAAEWLRYVEHDRGRKPSTIAGYRAIVRAQLVPAFGDVPVESITTALIEAWIGETDLAPSSRTKALVLLHGIFQRARRVYGLQVNPVIDVEKPPTRRSDGIEVYSPEEVMALVRAADSEQDAAIYLTAAYTGLRRGELLALRWRDIDFTGSVIRVRASFAEGALTTPKSGRMRSVPMASQVARALDQLSRRGGLTADDDLDGSALRRRYDRALARAGLRRLRFHDLRHTFGTRMIAKADIRRVQEWMGHADIQTTMKYLHYAPRAKDAMLVDEAFRLEEPIASQPNSMA